MQDRLHKNGMIPKQKHKSTHSDAKPKFLKIETNFKGFVTLQNSVD